MGGLTGTWLEGTRSWEGSLALTVRESSAPGQMGRDAAQPSPDQSPVTAVKGWLLTPGFALRNSSVDARSSWGPIPTAARCRHTTLQGRHAEQLWSLVLGHHAQEPGCGVTGQEAGGSQTPLPGTAGCRTSQSRQTARTRRPEHPQINTADNSSHGRQARTRTHTPPRTQRAWPRDLLPPESRGIRNNKGADAWVRQNHVTWSRNSKISSSLLQKYPQTPGAGSERGGEGGGGRRAAWSACLLTGGGGPGRRGA